MMVWQVARDLTRRLPEWDVSAKLSLAIAIMLLILLLGVGFLGPQAIRFPARIGAFGLLVTIQLLFLWGNRRDASPYHQAQQHFIARDYQAARELLEPLPAAGRASVDALVLLGNSYRHLGQLDRAHIGAGAGAGNQAAARLGALQRGKTPSRAGRIYCRQRLY